MKNFPISFEQLFAGALMVAVPFSFYAFSYSGILVNLVIFIVYKLIRQRSYEMRKEFDVKVIKQIKKTGNARKIIVGEKETIVEYSSEPEEQQQLSSG